MLNLTDVHLILGRRGSGKTTLAEELQKYYPRVVVFDPLEEMPHTEDSTYSFEEFGERLIKTSTNHEQNFKIVYHFDVHNEDHMEEFNSALRLIYMRGSVMVRVEEIHYFVTPHFLGHWFKIMLFMGRHRQVGFILTTQRPGECHKSIISQCNNIWVGPLHEKNDLAYVKTVLADKDDEIIRLPDRRFFRFRPGPHELTLYDNTLRPVKEKASQADVVVS